MCLKLTGNILLRIKLLSNLHLYPQPLMVQVPLSTALNPSVFPVEAFRIQKYPLKKRKKRKLRSSDVASRTDGYSILRGVWITRTVWSLPLCVNSWFTRYIIDLHMEGSYRRADEDTVSCSRRPEQGKRVCWGHPVPVCLLYIWIYMFVCLFSNNFVPLDRDHTSKLNTITSTDVL